jgi:ABC-type Na+ efflux pump permease subunit
MKNNILRNIMLIITLICIMINIFTPFTKEMNKIMFSMNVVFVVILFILFAIWVRREFNDK